MTSRVGLQVKDKSVCLERESTPGQNNRSHPSTNQTTSVLTIFLSAVYFPGFVLTLFSTGCDLVNNAERRAAPLPSRRHVPRFPDTEMRDNYRQPKPKPELMGSRSRLSCSTDPNGTRRGIGTTNIKTLVMHIHVFLIILYYLILCVLQFQLLCSGTSTLSREDQI